MSTKASTLSRAAEIVSRFAAVDNGSSPAVALYLQRTADAFNQLVQFHDKRSKLRKLESSPNLQTNVAEKRVDGESSPNLQIKGAEKRLDGNVGKDLGNKVRKRDKKDFNNLGETNLEGDEAEDAEISVKKKKKKKRTKREDNDMKEKSKAAVDS